MPFTCSICGEESTRICVRCTKDACNNHICDKCLRCSDCCECEIALSEPTHETVRMVVRPAIMEDDGPEDVLEDTPEDTPEDQPDEMPGDVQDHGDSRHIEQQLEENLGTMMPTEPEPEPHIPGPEPDPAPSPTPEEPGPAEV